MRAASARPLSRLLTDSGIAPSEPPRGDPEITGICLDSREVAPGNLFCALRGLEHDGARWWSEGALRLAEDRNAELLATLRSLVKTAYRLDDGRYRISASIIERACALLPD